MRKQFITGLFILAWFICIATNVVNAQTSPRFQIRIPFEFILSGQILPKGSYVVERIDQTKPNVVMLKNADNGTVRLLFTQRVEGGRTNEESCLIFTRRGQQLHLTQIWNKGNSDGLQVPSSGEKSGLDKRGSEASVQLKSTVTLTKRLPIAESKH